MHVYLVWISSKLWAGIGRVIGWSSLANKVWITEVKVVSSQIFLSLLVQLTSKLTISRRFLKLELVRCLKVVSVWLVSMGQSKVVASQVLFKWHVRLSSLNASWDENWASWGLSHEQSIRSSKSNAWLKTLGIAFVDWLGIFYVLLAVV